MLTRATTLGVSTGHMHLTWLTRTRLQQDGDGSRPYITLLHALNARPLSILHWAALGRAQAIANNIIISIKTIAKLQQFFIIKTKEYSLIILLFFYYLLV